MRRVDHLATAIAVLRGAFTLGQTNALLTLSQATTAAEKFLNNGRTHTDETDLLGATTVNV